MSLNYEEDVKIDETALDVMWLNHGSLAVRYARQAAHMRKLAKQAEDRVKVVKSELIRKANEDPLATTHKDKPTAADIEAYYRTHPDHKEAKEAWIEAEYQADYAGQVQMEMAVGRKAALENLVTLHGQQYFAGPSVPRDLSREAAKRNRQDASDDAVGKAMTRHKRS
jgi:hypothetical protein